MTKHCNILHLTTSPTDGALIASGAHRLCFIHPEDPQKCIKVIYSTSETAQKEIKRELSYYRFLNSYLTDWSGITKYYGTVETNLGTGYVYDRIVDFDGKSSQTISERYKIEELKDNWKELDEIISKLKKYMWDNRIITTALRPHNVLCHRISEKEIVPVICDSMGVTTRIPVVLYCPWLCHRKQKKLFARFDGLPLIQAVYRYKNQKF